MPISPTSVTSGSAWSRNIGLKAVRSTRIPRKNGLGVYWRTQLCRHKDVQLFHNKSGVAPIIVLATALDPALIFATHPRCAPDVCSTQPYRPFNEGRCLYFLCSPLCGNRPCIHILLRSRQHSGGRIKGPCNSIITILPWQHGVVNMGQHQRQNRCDVFNAPCPPHRILTT